MTQPIPYAAPPEHALSIPPIADSIFSFSSPMTILRIGRTCRVAKQAVRHYFKRAFNVNRLLIRFFPDVLAFRTLQSRTGTLISGSVALQFFDRDFYPSSDLDLYVHMRHRREVGRWLLQYGYRFAPSSNQAADFEAAATEALSGIGTAPYGMPGVAAIMNFIRCSDVSEDLKVQLIISRKTPMEVVLGFHSTCVMNVISFEKAYCLFPRATLEARLSLLSSSCAGRSVRRQASVAKYVARGFTITERIPPQDLRLPYLFPLGWRWIDDSTSWVIPLNTDGVTPPPPINHVTPRLLHDPVVVCNWEMRYTPLRGASMHYLIARSELLRYRYLISDRDLAGALERYFSVMLLEERYKERAETDVWRFYDSVFPALCRRFLQELIEKKQGCLRGI
ncbi:hypothetical protein C8T65DRAFT_144725 [Cerioporus squamosus]|nr:hypothetical protein C8T65DRAFT_144725 [Cerioporus squamosus]